VNVVYLPPVLPGELDLADLNRRLCMGGVVLDWSQVAEASRDQLAVLLAGLDLVEHSELLGIDTVPESLAEAVLQAFSKQDDKLCHSPEHIHSLTAKPTPTVWEPEQQTDQLVEASGSQTESDTARDGAAQSRPEPVRTVLQPPSPSVLRDELQRLVLQDLLGPAGGPEEELEETKVRDRYLVGALAPRDQKVDPEEMDELAIPEESSIEDGPTDETNLQSATLSPSAIGMSFCVEGTTTSLLVKASWGYYSREHSETLKNPKGSSKMVWKRRQMGGEPKIFHLKEGPIPPWSPEAEEQPNVVVRGLIRRTENFWTVTLFLVNEQREPEKNRDHAWIFQPELIVEAPDGAPIFQRRPSIRRKNQTDEEQMMAMLYRHHVAFAIGHGISVHAQTLPDDSTKAVRLSTRVVPSYEVPRTESPTSTEIPGLANLVLDMRELAESPATELARRYSTAQARPHLQRSAYPMAQSSSPRFPRTGLSWPALCPAPFFCPRPHAPTHP